MPRALVDSHRCPERGSRRVAPDRSSINERAALLARPKPPPPPRALKAAIARSASLSVRAVQVSDDIGVAEEQWPRLEFPLGQGQRLALAAATEPQHARPCCLRDGGCPVARAVVRNHDGRVRETGPQTLDRLADPLLLVPGGHENGEPVRHPCVGAGGIGGKMPSPAVSLTP